MTIAVGSLFSGCGGLDLGFLQNDFYIRWAYDSFQPAVDSYRHNLGAHITKRDLSVFTPQVPVDIVIGGPPCNDFSKVGKRVGLEGNHGRMTLQYLKIIDGLKPKMIVMETVTGVFRKNGSPQVLSQVLKKLKRMGYSTTPSSIDLADVNGSVFSGLDFGLAQTRERIFIVGVRRDLLPQSGFEFVKPQPMKHKTLREAFRGLSISLNDGSKIQHDLFHCGKYASEIKSKYENFHRRLDWDAPCPTVHTMFHSAYVHPKVKRRLTVRECARLQGFPDDFVFCGTPIQMYSQIGNAVPPPISFEVAKQIKKFYLEHIGEHSFRQCA